MWQTSERGQTAWRTGAHISARPQHPRQDKRIIEAFKKNFADTLQVHIADLPAGTPVEIWFQDEARLGQKNGLTRLWARKGTRPRQPADQRYHNAYLFGAICPAHGKGAALWERSMTVPAVSPVSRRHFRQRKTPGRLVKRNENGLCRWYKYPIVIKSWRKKWPNLSVYFKYPADIRRVIYTTNAIEAVHRQFRKLTKTKGAFPNENSLLKLLYMGIQNASKKWTMPLQNWNLTLSQLSIYFEGRLDDVLDI